MHKRGQQASAGGAGILIIVIAAILVMYILFLPPDERAALLGENDTSSINGEEITSSGHNKTLLKEHIGRLDYLKSDSKEHDIPAFRIYSQKEGTVLKTLGSLYVRNGLGNDKFYNMTFKIDESLTTDVKLSFSVKDSKGRLELYLNGHEIFNGYLSEGTPAPIDLGKELLEDVNVLSFKVSSPGLVFWRTNEYALENIMLTGAVLDISHSTSRQFFYVSKEEQLNLEEVKLKYYPTCSAKEVGPLMIYLNGEEVFSGVADCGIYNLLILDKNIIFEDKNELEFVATQGSYFLDRVSVNVDLEEPLYPVFYFELEEEFFTGDRLDDNYNVTMRLRFVNNEEKRLEYLINGYRKLIRTEELIYDRLLNDYVVEGTNSLELIPKTEADIVELKVFLDEEE
ncbi:MAG: hypothetical protein ABIB43_04450 [archaeon]